MTLRSLVLVTPLWNWIAHLRVGGNVVTDLPLIGVSVLVGPHEVGRGEQLAKL